MSRCVYPHKEERDVETHAGGVKLRPIPSQRTIFSKPVMTTGTRKADQNILQIFQLKANRAKTKYE
jgi:hypothetical protein